MRDSSLLLILALRHYGYPHAPEWMWGELFAMSASVALIACVLWIKPWWPIAAWAIGEEMLVFGCSAWWLSAPWDMTGQAEQCSAQIGLKLGAIGLAALAIITFGRNLKDITGLQEAKGAKE